MMGKRNTNRLGCNATTRGTMGKRNTNRLGCNAPTKTIYVHCFICLALLVLNIPFGQAQEEEAGRYHLRDGIRKRQRLAKGDGKKTRDRKTREILVDVGSQALDGLDETRDLAAFLNEAGPQTLDGSDETRELAALFPSPRNLKGKKGPPIKIVKGPGKGPNHGKGPNRPYYGIGITHPGLRPPKPDPAPPPPRPPTPRPTGGPPPRGPTPMPAPPPVGPPTAPPISGNRCQLPNLEFLQLTAVPPPIFVNPNVPDDQTLGTQYVYNDALFNLTTFDEITGSKVSGTCTRTQSREDNTPQGSVLGAGHCTFTYKLFDGQNTFTFSATGEIADSLGGILDITGGSQALLGAYGQIQLLPADLGNDGSFVPAEGDIFLTPLVYLADATIFFPCP